VGKHLLAKVYIAMLNRLTDLEVTELTTSTVNETALAIMKRYGSGGITIVTSQRKFIIDIEILSILTDLTDETLQTGI